MFNKNYTGWFEVYKTLREAYEPIFGSLVFTGFPFRPSELPDEEHWVTCEGWEGNLQYSCFANAIEVFPLCFHCLIAQQRGLSRRKKPSSAHTVCTP